ncbi:hypothetical protein [Mucilaginibacter sp. OK098]|uniref:hypothetical protein n=1 Tax=Mucilaginibacter sp. OK098 TaxID=1855297 RepID=UPI0013562F50|nr:hypothetical protein [Mucilaginibacter sp. OK098]
MVKQLLKELGVTIDKKAIGKSTKPHVPNALTAKTIEDARKGIGVGKPITNIKDYLNSL